jgi:hypothetical protein
VLKKLRSLAAFPSDRFPGMTAICLEKPQRGDLGFPEKRHCVLASAAIRRMVVAFGGTGTINIPLRS